MKLADLDKQQRTRVWIKDAIRYEEHEGVHTYHACQCGRRNTRSGRCAECWRDCLKELGDELANQCWEMDVDDG